MQPITSYASTNDKLRLLLQGPSGAGKTTVACQFPKPYIIDIDVNLGGTLRFLKDNNLPLPIGFDVLDRNDKGEEVPLKQRYLRLNDCLKAAQMDPNVETIVLDSGTTLTDVLVNEVLRQQGRNLVTDFKDGRQFWGFFGNLSKSFLAILTQMRKHIVLIVHEKTMTNTEGAVVYPVKIAWPGQVGQNMGIFFTNVWRCEVQSVIGGKYQWLIRTMPEYRYELKNTLGVPPTFEFKWETIQKQLDVAL
jgi:hypothetical protein